MNRRGFLIFLILCCFSFADAKGAEMCGRKGDMVEIVLDMQKPTVISIWRDQKLFINKDEKDGSLWAFSMPNTTVHPSAVCRREIKTAENSKIEVGFLCNANEKACNSFKQQALQRMDKVEREKK